MSTDSTQRLATRLSLATFVWLAVYAPAETYVTLSIAGLPGLIYSSYIMNVIGMGLMYWGAITTWRGAPEGPALLAIGWSWKPRRSGAQPATVSGGYRSAIPSTQVLLNCGWPRCSRRWPLAFWSHPWSLCSVRQSPVCDSRADYTERR